ncbi:MAG: response regulator, partial [Phycisphaerae bacterium]|nr:response regulator [Phycisphaerae bacterium]
MADEAIRILLVEDNPGDAGLIRAYLATEGAEAVELEHLPTLAQALQRLQDGPLDLLLLDLMLPDSSGLDTFREAHRHRPDLPIIVMTGLDVDEMAIRAVQEGAQDYLVKDHLDAPLLARSIRYAFERSQRQQMERSLRERDSELRIARKVQDGLHPVEAPKIDGYDIAGASISTEIVGGDYFDFIPMPESCLGIAVGDASGHGLGPALLAAEARATVRTLALTSATVPEILTRANHVLCEGMPD